MIPGLPNTYYITPLYKMEIYAAKKLKNLGVYQLDMSAGHMSVLFNPQSYKMTRHAVPELEEKQGEVIQQIPKSFGTETLSVEFFIDTFSAALEVDGLDGGRGLWEATKFTGNSELPSALKQLSAMDYAKQLYDLCLPVGKEHRPPDLILKWKDSLYFPCYMKNCNVEYTKFKETGVPVRATVKCTFVSVLPLSKAAKRKNPLESPDTSKFHELEQGETLNDLSQIAYSDPSLWREVASANNIINPRLLNSGDIFRMPAL